MSKKRTSSSTISQGVPGIVGESPSVPLPVSIIIGITGKRDKPSYYKRVKGKIRKVFLRRSGRRK